MQALNYIIMEKDELFVKAFSDVEAAIKLGTSVMYGHIKITPQELMVLYCLLRTWQDALGDNVPYPVNELINHIEKVAGNLLPALHECYKLIKEDDEADDHSSEIATLLNTTIENGNNDFPNQRIVTPIQRNKYPS